MGSGIMLVSTTQDGQSGTQIKGILVITHHVSTMYMYRHVSMK